MVFAKTPTRKTVIPLLYHELIFKKRNIRKTIQIVTMPTIADGIPTGANQPVTGVIISSRNKNGRTKTVKEPIANATPCFRISSGDNTNQPSGTDMVGYNAHVTLPFIAKSTTTQVKIAMRHATEKARNICF